MALVFDPATGSPQYQRGPLVADEFSQYLELLKQRKEQDRVRQETERKRQVQIDDRSRLMDLFEKYGQRVPIRQGGGVQGERAPATQPPFLPQGAPPEQGETLLPQPLAQLIQKQQEQATGVPDDVRQQGPLFGPTEPAREPALAPGTPQDPRLSQAGGQPPSGADPTAYINWLHDRAKLGDKAAVKQLDDIYAQQSGFGEAGGGLGKLTGHYRAFIDQQMKGTLPPEVKNFQDYLEWIETGKVLGKHPEDLPGKLGEEEAVKRRRDLEVRQELEPRLEGSKAAAAAAARQRVKEGGEEFGMQRTKFQREQRKQEAFDALYSSDIEDKLETVSDLRDDPNLGLLFDTKSRLGSRQLPAARDPLAKLEQLIGEGVIDKMIEMKNASSTGATGFGQLSNKEMDLLKNSMSALNTPGISADLAKEELSEISRRLSNMKFIHDHGVKGKLTVDDFELIFKTAKNMNLDPDSYINFINKAAEKAENSRKKVNKNGK